MDQDEILQIIRDWSKIISFIPREGYKNKIKQIRTTKEVIVLTGVRRSGKSTLLRQEIESLKKENDSTQILFLNFEDSRLSSNLNTKTLEEIFQVFKKEIYSKGEIFLFLDEIQNVFEWEKWVRTKHELQEANIYLTGSSSKLLSKELATVLTGRNININVYPLSFKEYLEFKKDSKFTVKELFDLYLEEGGFPKIAILENNHKEELQNYFQNIILRDIVARYNLKNGYNIQQVALYLVNNSAKLYSANKIRHSLKISLETSLNYIQYLKEVMLFFDLKKYGDSLKIQEISQKKIYCVDTGIINANGFRISKDKGRLLENMVFIELKRQNKEIFYHKDKKECDFLIKEGLKIVKAIQVCYDLNEDNKKREFDGLLEAMNKYKLKEGLLLTYDQEETIEIDGKKIIIKPVWKWLIE